MKNILKIFVITSVTVVAVGLAGSAMAKTIFYGKSHASITILFGEQTILRFPEAVKTITRATQFNIEPANSKEPDYSILAIRPRFTKSKGKVIFLLADGSVVKAKISTKKTDMNSEGFYNFERKEEEPNSVSRRTNEIPELELLKAMIRNRHISGYRIKKINKKLLGGEDDLNLYLDEVYQGKKFTGYVYKLINRSRFQTYLVDVRKLQIGHKNRAVVSSVERSLIKPGDSAVVTSLWVVVRASKDSSKLKIPFQLVKSSKKEASK